MIIYDTVKIHTPMSIRRLKLRGKHGWILGGVAQAQEPYQGVDYAGILAGVFVTAYYYHFWRKKEE